MSRRAAARLAAAAAAAAVAGCGGAPSAPPPEVEHGSPERGARAIDGFGCGSCHTIPGIDGADALVGPPLTHFSERGYIAGQLPNTPENLARWIQDPQAIEPGTAMPDLGVSRAEAVDIAAYLYTLE